ncbi:MarR family transcriptional regulator [Nocardioides sp. CCNWLW239]|uniref:MarR family transcriptional regulator n=1 Tax=Nocardioides sp. CCNWLW239 TaxID=3128902 RepID=UPI0030191935
MSEATGRSLAPVMERLVRLVREVSTAGEVSTTGAAVLARLGRLGGQRITDLARAEGVTQPAMTQLVNRLEHDGLVRRTADSADRRGVLVETTDRGREVIEARRTQRAEALEAALERLDRADRAAIAAALPALDRLVDAVLDS